MSQHTPHWECPGTDGDAWVICAKDRQGKRRTIAHVYQEANARLIVKAPEMYELIKGMLPYFEDDAHESKVIRALLREIEGEK